MPAAHSHRWDRAEAAVTGTGVTFYLTGSQAGFTIIAGAALSLEAQDRRLRRPPHLPGSGFEHRRHKHPNGSAGTKLVGAIYTATQTVSVSGGSGFGQQSPLMPIIADQIKFSGSMTANAGVTGCNMAAPSLGRSPTSDPLARRSSPQRMSPKRCPRQTRSCPALADLTTSEASTRAASRNLKPRSSAASVPAPRPRSHMRGLERNRSPPCVDR